MKSAAAFVADAARLSVATLVAHVILVAALPAISRLYGPAEFGGYALVTSVASVLGGAAMLRLDAAILSTGLRRQVAHRLLVGAVTILPVTAASAAVLLLLFQPDPAAAPAVLLAGLAALLVLANGLAQVTRAWALAQGRLNDIVAATLFSAACRAGGQIALAWPLGGSSALVLGECLGRFAAVLRVLRGQARRLPRLARLGRRIGRTLAEHRRFVLFGTPSALLDALGYAALVPAVAYAFGAVEAGLVAMAVRLLSVPGQVVSGNFGDTIQRELASRAQRSGDAAQRLLRFWALRLLALGVAVIAPIAAVCSAFAGLLLGAEWAGMGPIVPWLALHWICAFAIAPVSRVVLVADGQRRKLVYDVLAATLPLGLFFLLAASGLAKAVAAYSLGHVFCYGVYWLLIDRCSRSLDRVGA